MSTQDKRLFGSDWASLAAVSAWRLPLRWSLTGRRRPWRAGCAPRAKTAFKLAGRGVWKARWRCNADVFGRENGRCLTKNACQRSRRDVGGISGID